MPYLLSLTAIGLKTLSPSISAVYRASIFSPALSEPDKIVAMSSLESQDF
jgi:hypothetical protein